jgi:superfamily I DNA/RNA helicase
VVKLEQNYRSTSNILRTANAVIARNKERRPKRLVTEQSAGAPVIVFEGDSEREEAEFVAGTIQDDLAKDYAPRDFAVFYRTHAQSRVLEEALRVRNIPYVIVGGTRFYDRAEVKDLLSYLRVLMNPEDAIALLRIINVPARGIGNTTVDRLIAVTNDHKVSLSARLDHRREGPESSGTSGPAQSRRVPRADDAATRLAGLPPAELAEKVLEESGYRDFLAADTSIESEGRLENLLELVGQMRDFERETEEPTLSGFLERITLASDVDGYDADKGAVALMTVHTAKGLEFDVVFVTGLRRRHLPAPAQHRRRRRHGGRTPPVLRGRHARTQAPAPVPRALAPAVGANLRRHPQPLSCAICRPTASNTWSPQRATTRTSEHREARALGKAAGTATAPNRAPPSGKPHRGEPTRPLSPLATAPRNPPPRAARSRATTTKAPRPAVRARASLVCAWV